MVELLSVRHIDARQTIIRKGDPSDELYVIVFGQAGVYAAHGSKLLRLGTLERPAAIGEIGAVDGGARTATVVADTPMEVLVVSLRDLSAALDKEPIAWKGIAHALATLARGVAEKEADLLRDLRNRLARLLLRLADPRTGAVRASQRELAEQLGTARSAIIPHLTYFRQRGLITEVGPIVVLRHVDLQKEAQ